MIDERYKLKSCLSYNDTLTEIKKESLEFLAEYICKINNTYNKLVDRITNLQQENNQLKNNWDKLREYCNEEYYGVTTIGVLEKMKELEKGDNNGQ